MADSEFEEFRSNYDSVPHNIKASVHTYTLVPTDILEQSSPTSSNCDSPTDILEPRLDSDIERQIPSVPEISPESNEAENWPTYSPSGRRRRKLPEIPKHKKRNIVRVNKLLTNISAYVLSLAEELGDALHLQFDGTRINSRNILMLKYLRDEDLYGCDVDSGNSTAHSPDGPKSTSPLLGMGSITPASTESSSLPCAQLELLEATHRGLHKFIPRHRDELDVEIGDPLYIQKEAEDLWCEGVNLRTGRQGIFPSAYAVDMDYNDFDPTTPKVKQERFLLGYLGSVETMWHKGTSVLCQAVNKIKATNHKPHQCILEISDQGIRMVDKTKKKNHSSPCQDYFYSLKNVSFCAFHPTDHRYMGFITKHPNMQRFACHVFLGSESTRPVAESVGRAFQRFYTKYIETAYPVEDIYIE